MSEKAKRKSEIRPNLTVEKEKFDALLKRMIDAKPTQKSEIKASRRNKLGQIIPHPK